MPKLRFDPITYQFYFNSQSPAFARAKAAGFVWDPIRSRYYTADPQVAKAIADCGDHCIKQLLADALGVVIVTDAGTEKRPRLVRH